MKEEIDDNDAQTSVVHLTLLDLVEDKIKNEGELKKWKICVAKKWKVDKCEMTIVEVEALASFLLKEKRNMKKRKIFE